MLKAHRLETGMGVKPETPRNMPASSGCGWRCDPKPPQRRRPAPLFKTPWHVPLTNMMNSELSTQLLSLIKNVDWTFILGYYTGIFLTDA